MVRLSIAFLLVILCCATNSFAAVTTDKWQQELEMKLDEKINKVEARNVQLENKVNQLENQRILDEELRKDLTIKVTRLEAKNVQLEAKVEEQEKILNFLLKAAELPDSAYGSKLFPNIRKNATLSNLGKMSAIPRTCRELKAMDPSFASGMQWIDPDGQGIGDDPIYVYCDMSTGSTSVLHDSESPDDVGHCADPGCYSRLINYNATIKQIKALAELSSECHQSIKYECYMSPFEYGGQVLAWWNDRDGHAQYFWAGNNTDGIHTCQCGIDGDCVDNSFKCNCDAAAPIPLVDDGVITDKNVLPITQLHFGRTQPPSYSVHTLGRFECSGSVALTGLPTSCEDLWLIGHTLNGFYSIKGNKMMESVYCDFTKIPGEADFQKWIGYANVKSLPVHFYVLRNSNFATPYTPIPFQLAMVNEGNAMDLTSGIFTAPRPGIYFFSFTGLAEFPATTSSVYLAVELYLNGDLIGRGWVEESNTVAGQNDQLSVQSTVNLKKGDQVWVGIDDISSGAYLYDGRDHLTHFTGFMLEEEIVASL